MAIDASKVYAVWLREVKRFTNSTPRMVSSLAVPLFFLAALGGGFSSIVPGFNYQAFILPGILAMTLMFTSIQAGISIIWDREFGFLKEMLAAPVSRTTLVIGRTLGGATAAILQGIIILIIGTLLTGTGFPSIIHLLATLALMITLSCFLVAVGICFASVVQEVETFQLLMSLIVMPLFFLSNSLFPIEKMPTWLQVISRINPISYAVDGLRNLMIGTGSFSIWLDLGVAFGGLAIALSLATYLFNKTSI